MAVPVVVLGESLVDAVVEVLVVGEDDVATDIVELRSVSSESRHSIAVDYTYEAFRGDIGGSKTTGGLVAVDNHPRGAVLQGPSRQYGAPRYNSGEDTESRTIWFNRFAAPKPVGPAPMTSTSTELSSRKPLSVMVLMARGTGGGRRAPYMSGWVILPCRISWKLGTRFNVLRARLSIENYEAADDCSI
jgi:hypothetical protein